MQYKIPNWLIWGMVVVSFLGFLDASYLTVSHYSGAELNCSLTSGCGTVTTSKYSLIFGVPVALFGMLYYLGIFVLSLIYTDTKSEKIPSILPPLTLVGFLFSLWFVYVQLFLLNAICQYCMASAITSTLLFIGGLSIFLGKRKQSKQ